MHRRQPCDDVLGPDIVMGRHDENAVARVGFGGVVVRSDSPSVAQAAARAPVGQVDDAIDGGEWFVDEAPQTLLAPVIARASGRSPFMPCRTTTQCPSSVTITP